jgi:hypothetical protein
VSPGLFQPYDLILLIAALIAAAFSVALGENLIRPRSWMVVHVEVFLLAAFIALPTILAARLLAVRIGGGTLSPELVHRQVAHHLHWRTLLAVARFCVAVEVMMLFYTTFKQRIPRLHPGSFDAQLIRLEEMLHFGINPSLALAGAEWPRWVMIFLDHAYLAWFPVKVWVLVYVITHLNARLRDRFLVAYLGIWLAGVLVGLAVPSAGPFFVDPEAFTADGTIRAWGIQNNLRTHWEDILQTGQEGRFVYGYGLMALPSLHVAAVVLYAIFGWAEGWAVRWGTIAFAGVIFVGSLATGWHYALDGYAAALIAWGVWWLAGRLVPRDRYCKQVESDSSILV